MVANLLDVDHLHPISEALAGIGATVQDEEVRDVERSGSSCGAEAGAKTSPATCGEANLRIEPCTILANLSKLYQNFVKIVVKF